tara:strand:- start:141 stop:875 length:735 start_codon:yes stop_codon:yes gene_type:complete
MSNLNRIHNDYLDPDRYYNHDADEHAYEDEMFNKLKKVLNDKNSGRWDWEQIDNCWTWKDSDLESYGHQGLSLDSVTSTHEGVTVKFTVHGGKTFVGHDVVMNLPKHVEEDDKIYQKVLDIYMEHAENNIMCLSSAGEWDGDSWYMTYENEVELKFSIKFDEDEDPEKWAEEIISKAKKDIQGWEKEMESGDRYQEELSGWKHEGEKCELEKPGPNSVWNLFCEHHDESDDPISNGWVGDDGLP